MLYRNLVVLWLVLQTALPRREIERVLGRLLQLRALVALLG